MFSTYWNMEVSSISSLFGHICFMGTVSLFENWLHLDDKVQYLIGNSGMCVYKCKVLMFCSLNYKYCRILALWSSSGYLSAGITGTQLLCCLGCFAIRIPSLFSVCAFVLFCFLLFCWEFIELQGSRILSTGLWMCYFRWQPVGVKFPM